MLATTWLDGPQSPPSDAWAAAAAAASLHAAPSAPPPGLGALFVTHAHPAATLAALRSWRALYPGATLVLRGDVGSMDYSGLATTLGDASWSMSKERVSALTWTTALGARSARVWVDLMRDAFAALDARGREPLLILLEPDVRVLRVVQGPLPCAIHGDNPDVRAREWVLKWAAAGRPPGADAAPLPRHFGGCGGAVFNASFWGKLLLPGRGGPPRQELEAAVEALFAAAPAVETQARHRTYPAGILGTDEFMTALALRYGGALCPLKGMAEDWQPDARARREGLAGPPVEIYHKDKSLYGASLSDDDVRELRWDYSALPVGVRLRWLPAAQLLGATAAGALGTAAAFFAASWWERRGDKSHAGGRALQ